MPRAVALVSAGPQASPWSHVGLPPGLNEGFLDLEPLADCDWGYLS